jgi:hypothetical protein
MDGAIESGERVAKDVHALLSKVMSNSCAVTEERSLTPRLAGFQNEQVVIKEANYSLIFWLFPA